jgi:hypothetical protein
MVQDPLFLAGVAATLGAAAVVVYKLLLSRRRRQIELRREQMRALSRRHGLEFLGRHVPVELEAHATVFAEEASRVRLDEVLQGQDQSGRFRFARRKLEGHRQQILAFELRYPTGLRGLCIAPVVSAGGRSLLGSWSRRRRKGPVRMSLRWEAEPEQLRTRESLDYASEFLDEMSSTCEGPSALPMGLEIDDRRVVLFSLEALDGPTLAEFVRRSLHLRERIVRLLLRQQQVQIDSFIESRLLSVDERRIERMQEAETAPLFPMPQPRSARELAELRTRPILTLDALQLSAEHLVRNERPRRAISLDKGATRGWRIRNGKRVFEIPEPEEEVVVLRPQ